MVSLLRSHLEFVSKNNFLS